MSATRRTVTRLIDPEPTMEGAGVKLNRLIAGRQIDWIDPFLLLDHFGSEEPADYMAGFPMHPHRGIETVTYMLDGETDHRDTMGNAGTIGPGGVQWMSAGGGLLHEEMPRPVKGRLEGFQLWVNLPASLKMSRPNYQEFTAEQIPEARRDDGTVVRVVAGETDGVRGAVTEIAMRPTYLDVHLAPGASFVQPVPQGHAAFAYAYRGGGMFGIGADGNGTAMQAPRLAILGDGGSVEVRAGTDGARFLLVSGQPTREAIARYGPFVMNTRAEIMQAVNDLNNGTFVWQERKGA
ncbi:MAG: pirin family protein [Burkholderiales bacterium]